MKAIPFLLLIVTSSVFVHGTFPDSEENIYCNNCELAEIVKEENLKRSKTFNDLKLFLLHNMHEGHSVLNKMLLELGVNPSVEDHMPMEAYLIRYLHFISDKLTKKIDDSNADLKQWIIDRENKIVDISSSKEPSVEVLPTAEYLLPAVYIKEVSPIDDTTNLNDCPNDVNIIQPSFPTASSSVYQDSQEFASVRGVDGNSETLFHSKYEENPWWSIDLLQEYFITKLEVIFRSTQVGRFTNVSIFLSTVPEENPDNFKNLPMFAFSERCLSISSTILPKNGSFAGRYMYIQMNDPGSHILEFFDIHIYSCIDGSVQIPAVEQLLQNTTKAHPVEDTVQSNVCLHEVNIVRPSLPTDSSSVYMDSSYQHQIPPWGIDGKNDTMFHSKYENGSWWSVDLLQEYFIPKIHILLRSTQLSRFSNAIIYLSTVPEENPANFTNLPIFAVSEGLLHSSSTFRSAKGGSVGRYLYIQLNETIPQNLEFYEISIYTCLDEEGSMQTLPNEADPVDETINSKVCPYEVDLVRPFLPVASSSVYKDNPINGPINAVNGNNATTMFHSKREDRPWWSVDLLQEYFIPKIHIIFRYWQVHRFDNVTIYLSTVPEENPDNFKNLPIFAVSKGRLSSSSTILSKSGGFVGRYMYIQINKPGPQILEFLQIAIYGCLKEGGWIQIPAGEKLLSLLHEGGPVDSKINSSNVCFHEVNIVRPSLQTNSSSIYSDNVQIDGPAHGVDGKTDTLFHSKYEEGPWWSVDLHQEYFISKIHIILRAPQVGRFINVTIYLSTTPEENPANFANLPIFAVSQETLLSSSTIQSPSGGFVGRYMYIQINEPGPQILEFYELSIYTCLDDEGSMQTFPNEADPVDETINSNVCPNEVNIVQPSFPTASSSVYHDIPDYYDPAHGIDGNNETSFFHSRYEIKPWWSVDLLQEYFIPKIHINLRAAQVGRFTNVTIYLSTVPEENPDNFANLPIFAVSEGWLSPSSTILSRSGGFGGRYMYIQLNNPDPQILEFYQISIYTCNANE